MNVPDKDKWKVWMPLLFSLVLILGMVFGFNLKDTLRNKRAISTVIQRNDRLEEIIDLVKEKYADTVNSNLLYKDAITGILRSLDPHTLYFPAEEAEGMNDDLEGGFSGIGVEFSIVKDTIEITSVADNGPASHAGVQTGDQLIQVGDSIVAGNNITAERITKLLKGKQHSSVLLTLRLGENGSQKRVSITRDIIPTYSVDASIMLDSITGFIKINRFTATTYQEFSTALIKLKSAGMKQMILDLRDDPGGYLDAATSIAGDFLADNRLIVYTKGVHSGRIDYKAKENAAFEQGRLAILMDEGSASASEILAGAVQDWDRGIIAGRRSYGKGLVQEQYEMPDGAAIRLTVAKYYTPSGRCIQRPFSKGREAYEQDFENRFESGELTGMNTEMGDTTPFYTANRRVVYGGGGIKPDVYVPYDTGRIAPALVNILLSEELRGAIWDYFVHNRAKLKFRGINEFNRSFASENEIIASYLNVLNLETRKKVTKELNRPEDRDYISVQIKAQIARFLFRDNRYYAISLKDDEMVIKARAILKSDEYTRLLHPVSRH